MAGCLSPKQVENHLFLDTVICKSICLQDSFLYKIPLYGTHSEIPRLERETKWPSRCHHPRIPQEEKIRNPNEEMAYQTDRERAPLPLREEPFLVFVSNLLKYVSKAELEAMFGNAGRIVDIFIPVEQGTRKNRGFVFV